MSDNLSAQLGQPSRLLRQTPGNRETESHGSNVGQPGYLRRFSQKGVVMKKSFFLLIVLMSVLLCVPGPGFTKMTAMTENEMGDLTGQGGIAVLPGDVIQSLNTAALNSAGWAASANALGYGLAGLYQMAETGCLPMDTPIQLDMVLTGKDAEPLALQSLTLATGAMGLVNPMMFGLMGLGSIPGAFDVAVGDVSMEISGTIEFSMLP
jgi:hypothetical protein